MATDVLMPQMGESITEGTVVKWLKKVGETVQRDEPLLEISTDKVDAEIPAPAAGVVTEILAKEGDTVAVNSVLARLGEAGEVGAGASAAAAAAAPRGACSERSLPAKLSASPGRSAACASRRRFEALAVSSPGAAIPASRAAAASAASAGHARSRAGSGGDRESAVVAASAQHRA